MLFKRRFLTRAISNGIAEHNREIGCRASRLGWSVAFMPTKRRLLSRAILFGVAVHTREIGCRASRPVAAYLPPLGLCEFGFDSVGRWRLCRPSDVYCRGRYCLGLQYITAIIAVGRTRQNSPMSLFDIGESLHSRILHMDLNQKRNVPKLKVLCELSFKKAEKLNICNYCLKSNVGLGKILT